MYFLKHILWISSVFTLTQAECPSGWFGLNCQYQCHCVGGCSENGTCNGGLTCYTGWFGHLCQYQDVAFEAEVTGINFQAFYCLTDNNDSSCNNDSGLNSVTLKWNSTKTILWLRVTFKSQNLGSSLSITLKDQFNTYFSSGSSYHQVDIQTLDIGCGFPAQSIMQITLTGLDVKDLCSVYVSSGCGIGYFGNHCDQNCEEYCSGFIHCDPNNRSCLYPNIPTAETTTLLTTKKLTTTELTTKQLTTNMTPLESSNSTGIIVGCVLGVGTGIVIIIIALVILIRKRRKKENSNDKRNIRMTDVGNHSDREKDLKRQGYNRVKFLQNTSIDVSKLATYLQTHDDVYLTKQFKKDPKPVNVTMHAGQRSENQPKNNFPDILPYDNSRVHFKVNSASDENDYINASYIRRINEEVLFIASQSPNEDTVDDFIRMIMEQNIKTVVMLNDGQELKCRKYWPESGCLRFGSVLIKLLSKTVYSDYIVRNFELINAQVGEQPLLVKQFQFTSWTSKSLPWTTWSFVEFQQKIASHHSSGPLLVHCRDGIGRTGMFIALYDIIRQAEVNGHVDFFKTLIRLRQDRINMISNSDQYIFLHHAAYLAVVCLSEAKKGSVKLDKEFMQVADLCNFLYKKEKSQNENFYTEVEGKLDDACRECFVLPNFKNQACKIFLPHPKSATDFWTIVVNNNVSVVIAFELDDLYCDEIVAEYLPPSTQDTLHCPPFDVKCTDSSSGHHWDEHTLTITHTENKTVKHFKPNFQDSDTSKLITLLQHSSGTRTGYGATLFVCRNGLKYCGIACIVSLMLSSLAQNSFVSIPLLVTSVKALNPDIIPTCDKYKLVYQALQECQEMSASGNEYDQPEGKSEETSDYAKWDETDVYDVVEC